jgi:hypothetical protein
MTEPRPTHGTPPSDQAGLAAPATTRIFDPTSAPTPRALELAPMPATLDGARVLLVENTKFNSETLLRKLAERLGRTRGLTVSGVHRKRSPSHEIEEGVIPGLRRQADLVISGIGD